MKNAIAPLILFCVLKTTLGSAASVDTLVVESTAMKKSLKAVVILPDAYTGKKVNFPVLYLLHGGGGGYRDWVTRPNDKRLLHNLAERHNIIIVTPDGGEVSYYFDSPLDKTSQYETFISDELIRAIDQTYRTVGNRNGRVIAGLSMGGHGAFFLATRHPELFCAAGSMSGVMNINTASWNVGDEFRKLRRERFASLLGPPKESTDPYPGYTLVTMTEQMKTAAVNYIFDCGVDDFLIGTNRDLHEKLLDTGVPHVYIERPGAHTWEYWQEALPYHLLFFDRFLVRE